MAGALPDPVFLGMMRVKSTPEGFLVPALEALLWSAIAIIMATLVTRVIYGLRKQVRDARKLGQYTLLQMLGRRGHGGCVPGQPLDDAPPHGHQGPARQPDGQGLERFEREVQLTSQLTHPNTIAIYDYGRTAEGLFYYVMEYLEGMDLERLMVASGPLPPARVIHILRQVCGALEEAHGLGLLHRDIKPANLFLCRRRRRAGHGEGAGLRAGEAARSLRGGRSRAGPRGGGHAALHGARGDPGSHCGWMRAGISTRWGPWAMRCSPAPTSSWGRAPRRSARTT